MTRLRHWFIPALHRRYGDVFTIRTVPKRRPLVMASTPEMVRAVFAAAPDTLYGGRGNAVLRPMVGDRSVLVADGADHRRLRRLLMPAFHGASLRSYPALVADLAVAETESWVPGRPFSALARMHALTLEVILHVVFGVTDEVHLARLRPLVRSTIDVTPMILLGLGYPSLRRVGPWRANVRNQWKLRAELATVIAERRTVGDLDQRSDVLSRLLSVGSGDTGEPPLTDDELVDQLVTLLLAGHETTATALAWCLHELARHPEHQRRAQEAADAGDTVHLQAVFDETLRLHPVLAQATRFAKRETVVGTALLPARSNVAASILLAHRDAAHFPDPERFDPGRFLGAYPAPNTWIPYGGGVRRCLGAGFAAMEANAVLTEILRRYDVSAAVRTPERPRVRNITSSPAGGAKILVTPRTP